MIFTLTGTNYASIKIGNNQNINIKLEMLVKYAFKHKHFLSVLLQSSQLSSSISMLGLLNTWGYTSTSSMRYKLQFGCFGRDGWQKTRFNMVLHVNLFFTRFCQNAPLACLSFEK